MNLFIHYRNDIRQIARDPIMLILLVAPLLMVGLFKLLISLLGPFLLLKTGFDLSPWYPYVLSFTLLMIPGMLGIVTGFMMLDEKDGNIAELLSVTPLGRSGYLINRLSFSALLSVFYCFIAFFLLNIYTIPIITLAFLSLMLALYSAIIGLLLFSGADDKVKGLTFAKGLNILALFAFTDIVSLNWLTVLSWLFPTYWITAVIKNPNSAIALAAVFVVHICWLGVLIIRYWRGKR